MEKQVNKSHYDFSSYMTKQRWLSIWHQLDEVLSLNPNNVLEIGPGPGLFKLISAHFGVIVETLDIDPDLMPDHIASADNIPLNDDHYDVVCAFQMLEHLPFEKALQVFKEMIRVSKKYIVISLPNAQKVWPYKIYVPKFGIINFSVPEPKFGTKLHKFDGQHHWELNKKDFSTKEVIKKFSEKNNVNLVKSYRVEGNPYHHFFIFELLPY